MRFLIKAALICGIGSALEWYDFALFGALAPLIAKLFFPLHSSTSGLLLTFATFASGFLMRPFGAAFFGSIGDRHGRKAALSITIILMAISTMLFGLSPVYSQYGPIVSVYIIFLRLLQGFAASGEYPNAIALLTELSPKRKAGFYGSFSVFGVVSGVLLGSITPVFFTHCMSENNFNNWGWRIPFLISAPLGLLGYYLRTHLTESSIFLDLIKNITRNNSPVYNVVKNHVESLLLTFSVFMVITVSFYTIFIYLGAYLVSINKITMNANLKSNAIGISVYLLLLPLFGYLSDHLLRQHMIMTGYVLLLVFTLPIFNFVLSNASHLLFAEIFFAVIIAIILGPAAAYVSDVFPVDVRVSGISLGLNIAAALFGGLAPLISMCLLHLTRVPITGCFYMLACTIFALIISMKYRKLIFIFV